MAAYNTDLKLSKSKIINWYKIMGDRCGVKYIQKKSSILMHIVSFFLWIANKFSKNITSRKEFMNDFTTTIYNRIYISYEIGDSGEMPYRSNISHIIHEITHTEQFRRNRIMMPLRYVFSQKWRARYEAEAFMSHVEFAYKYGLSGTSEEKMSYLALYITRCCDKLQRYYGVSRSEAMKHYNEMMEGLRLLSVDENSMDSDIVKKAYEALVELGAI